MGYILHVLAAVSVLGLAESGWASERARPAGVALLLVLPHALSLVAGALGRRGRFRSAHAVGLVLDHAAPLAYTLCVLALGWTRTVEQTFGLEPGLLGWPGPGMLLSLAPYALLECLAIDARARLHTSASRARVQAAAFERRMFASSFLPFVLYVCVAALVGANETLRVRLEEIGLFDTLFTLVALGGFVALLPAILRRTWSTAPLPAGPLRTMLEEIARRAGFRFRELCVWSTGERMANAAILGVTASQRTVLFSDALLAQLTPREIGAVFAHEMGHARRHHAPFFVVTLAFVFFGLKLAVRGLPDEGPALELGLLAVLVALWALGLGYVSRRFELEADLESLELIGEPGPLASALVQVGGAHAHRRSSWRHFSNAQRIEFLERAARDPAVGTRLRSRLRRARAAFVAACVAVMLIETWLLVRDLPEERVVVALRLGEYEHANGLAQGRADGELERLVARASSLADGAPPSAIEQRALDALAAGDARAARELLQLALLREERGDLEALVASLERVEVGEELDPSSLEGFPERWRVVLSRVASGSS